MAGQGEEQLERDADINRLDRTHHVAGAIGFQNGNRHGWIGLHHWQNDGRHEATVQLRVVGRHGRSNARVGAPELPNLPASATTVLRRRYILIHLEKTQLELRV
ncbi:hypothetical protein PIB30_033176 [Stylosanthes scabra]|uniref:Uncharacterized protein n=1 Tax=Stylosanthes scabra TaxID=79078 RepID=A0ABU6ZB02_9FABA|nr:hypothetical protein [Stylosanthes scabra]